MTKCEHEMDPLTSKLVSCDARHGSIEIRRATVSDREGIALAHAASIRGLATDHYTAEQIAAWSSGKNPERYPVDTEEMYVAVKDGEVVGFGELHLANHEVRAVYISPKIGRQGVGAAMLAKLEGIAKANGLVELTLGASLNAVPFYLRYGYQEVSRDKKLMINGTPLPYVTMVKGLR